MRLRKLFYYFASLRTLVGGVHNWPVLVWDLMGLPLGRPYLMKLCDGVRFQINGFMDAWIVKETYLDRTYEHYGVALQPDWTVIDIGAFLGDFAVFAAERVTRGRIYAFEPVPDSYRLLLQNLDLNRLARVTAHPCAITGNSGPQTLYLFANHAEQNSLLPSRMAGERTAVIVEGITLLDAFAMLALDHCDFLKLDCEGAEYAILFGAPPELFSRITHICLEYHDGVTAFSHADLVRFLAGLGFQVRHSPSGVQPNEGFIYAFNPASDRQPRRS
jgi:FkbM family methyltransferase